MIARAILRATHCSTEWWIQSKQFSEIEESCIGGVQEMNLSRFYYIATEEARATAERIRSSIQGIKTENEVQVTVSIGVCATDLENKNSTQEILDFADRAMYKSKQAGRNRVTTWASMVGS